MVCPCDWHRQRRDAEEHSAELKARDCARRCPEFETAAAAAEMELTRAVPLPECDLSWRRPDLERFAELAEQELGWPPDQSLKWAAPLLARWQLQHGGGGGSGGLRALQVVRTSRHHHVDCYLVRWRLDGSAEELETHEPRPLVEAAHRQLVDAYLQAKKKPKKAAARQPRKAKAADSAGPQAKIATGSPSRLITDFFQIRKKGTQHPAVESEKTGPPQSASATSEASSSAGSSTQNPGEGPSLHMS